MRYLIALLVGLIPLTSTAQYTQRPVEFTDFVRSEDAEKYFKDGSDLTQLSFTSGKNWKVWSAIDKNPYFKTASNSQKAGELSMCEIGLVTDVQGDWIQLEDKGWVKASSMILAPWALRATGAVGRKALIVPNIGAAANAASGAEQRQMYRHFNLSPSQKWEGRRAKRFKVLYILKETTNSYLLATSPYLDGTSALTTVRGWISKDFVTEWNRKVAYGPNFGSEARTSLGPDTIVPFFNSLSALNTYSKTCNSSIGLTETIREERLIPKSPAFPDIGEFNRSEDNTTRELLTITGASPELTNLQISIAEQLELYTNQISNINLMFIVDATASMGRYYPSISNVIEEITQWTQNYQADVNIKIGFGVYRDYLDDADAFDSNGELQPFDQSLKNSIQQVVCKSKNPVQPEAVYLGFIENIAAWEPNPSHTNIIVWIGDEGNHENDGRHTREEVLATLNKIDASLFAFQATTYMTGSSARFQQDALDWANSSLKRNQNDGIACSFERTEPGVLGITFDGPVTFKKRRQAKIITQPIKPGKKTPPSKLVEVVRGDLSQWIDEVQQNIQKLREVGLKELSESEKEELIVLLVSQGYDKDAARSFVEAGGDIAVPRYTSLKPCNQPQSDLDLLIPYVFISQQDYNRLTNNFLMLEQGGTTIDKQESLYKLCKNLILATTGQDPVALDKYLNKTMNEIWIDLFQVDFNIKGLKNTKVKNIKALDGGKFNNAYKAIARAAAKWEDLTIDDFEWRLSRTPNQKFYWVPAEFFPGFSE